MADDVVALLPMKAHSERIPGKNFREIAGKPLFRWVLDTLLSVPAIREVVINTDARQLLAEHGLEDEGRVRIRDRRQEIRGDYVSMNTVIADDIATVEAGLYLMTHATNPLLSAMTIASAIESLRGNPEYDSLFSVNKVQTRFYRTDGSSVNHDPGKLMRTQDLEPWFEENSCLYLFTGESFAATNARIGRRPLMFEMPRLESVDIDDADDCVLAQALLERVVG